MRQLLIITARQRTSMVNKASKKSVNSTQPPRMSIAKKLINTRSKLTSIPANKIVHRANYAAVALSSAPLVSARMTPRQARAT